MLLPLAHFPMVKVLVATLPPETGPELLPLLSLSHQQRFPRAVHDLARDRRTLSHVIKEQGKVTLRVDTACCCLHGNEARFIADLCNVECSSASVLRGEVSAPREEMRGRTQDVAVGGAKGRAFWWNLHRK